MGGSRAQAGRVASSAPYPPPFSREALDVIALIKARSAVRTQRPLPDRGFECRVWYAYAQGAAAGAILTYGGDWD